MYGCTVYTRSDWTVEHVRLCTFRSKIYVHQAKINSLFIFALLFISRWRVGAMHSFCPVYPFIGLLLLATEPHVSKCERKKKKSEITGMSRFDFTVSNFCGRSNAQNADQSQKFYDYFLIRFIDLSCSSFTGNNTNSKWTAKVKNPNWESMHLRCSACMRWIMPSTRACNHEKCTRVRARTRTKLTKWWTQFFCCFLFSAFVHMLNRAAHADSDRSLRVPAPASMYVVSVCAHMVSDPKSHPFTTITM